MGACNDFCLDLIAFFYHRNSTPHFSKQGFENNNTLCVPSSFSYVCIHNLAIQLSDLASVDNQLI